MHQPKHPLSSTLFAAFLACSIAAQDHEAEPVVIGHKLTLESKILNETRTIRVSLPRQYARGEQRCGVVYLLDDASFFTTAVGSVRHLEDRHLPLIVVGIRNTERTRDLTPPATAPDSQRPGAGGSANFRRFLLEELRPFLRERYRTTGMNILIGHSLGGLFVVETMLEQPDAFHGYLALSPSLWWDDRKLVERVKSIPEDHGIYDQFVYFSVGDEGERMNPPFEDVVWSLKSQAPDRFRWKADRFPGEGHYSVAVPAIYAGIKAYFAPVRDAAELEATTFAELQAHYSKLHESFGFEVPLSSSSVTSAAMQLATKGRLEESVALFDKGLEQFPNEPILHVMRADSLARAKRYQEASVGYQAAIEAYEKNPDPRLTGFNEFVKRRIERTRARAAAGKDNGKDNGR